VSDEIEIRIPRRIFGEIGRERNLPKMKKNDAGKHYRKFLPLCDYCLD
jgi:hypothetical protein